MLEEAELFGPDGKKRDREKWLIWLDQIDAGARAAFDGLASGGCDSNRLTDFLMELHATRDWKPVTGRKAEAFLGHIRKAATSIKALAVSDLRYFLGEEPPGEKEGVHLENIAKELEGLAQSLQTALHQTTGRESLLRNWLLLHLVTFVGWSTGSCRDDDLDLILQAVFRNDKWSILRWRRDHKKLFKERLRKKWESKWSEQVIKGKLKPPSPRRRHTRATPKHIVRHRR